MLRSADPAGARKSLVDYLHAMKDMEMPMGMGMNGEPMTVTYDVSHEADAVQIAGQQVDTYSVKTIYPEAMAQMGPMAGMLDTFGTYDGYIAQTAEGVVMTTTQDAALLESTFQAVAGQGGLGGDAGIRASASELPANLAAATFIGVDGIVNLLAAAGMPIQPAENLEPIAMGIAVVNNAGEYKMHVPFGSAKFIGTAVQQAIAMMMMGGVAVPM